MDLAIIMLRVSIQFFQDNQQDTGKFVEVLKPLQIEVMK